MAEKGKMTVGEAGRRGGMSTLKKYGPGFYEQIGKIGGQRVKKLVEAGKKVAPEVMPAEEFAKTEDGQFISSM